MQQSFIHHVYFWLKNPANQEDRQMLLNGIKTLIEIPSIQSYHLGISADTDRGVIDNTYVFSWLTIFKDKTQEAIYQQDPIHLAFVQNCSHLWSKVIVYDSIPV